MKYVGAIDLKDDEKLLLKDIDFYLDASPRDDVYQIYLKNAASIPQLMASLLGRDAIPEHRIKYFTDPAYRAGRLKGSYRDLFEKNGTTGVEIFKHANFLKHLRYFVFGSELQLDVLKSFQSQVDRLSPISPGDVQALCAVARELINEHRILPQDAAEQFFQLCLDCGVPLMHASAVRDVIGKMKLRKA